MSFAAYILVLVAGGVVIGVLVGLLVRRTSSEGMVPPIVLGVIATVVAGVVTALVGAPKIIGVPVALTLAALYVSRSGLSDKSAGHWFGGADGGGGWGDGDGDG